MSEILQSCDWQKHETRYGLLIASSPTLHAVAYCDIRTSAIALRRT